MIAVGRHAVLVGLTGLSCQAGVGLMIAVGRGSARHHLRHRWARSLSRPVLAR